MYVKLYLEPERVRVLVVSSAPFRLMATFTEPAWAGLTEPETARLLPSLRLVVAVLKETCAFTLTRLAMLVEAGRPDDASPAKRAR